MVPPPLPGTTRWCTALSSKVNLPHAINLKAVCGANVVTLPSNFGRIETFVLHHAATSSGSIPSLSGELGTNT